MAKGKNRNLKALIHEQSGPYMAEDNRLNFMSKKVKWCLTSTETTKIIRVGEIGGGGGGGRGYGGGGRGRLYTYRYTVTTRMTPALRWAAMRAF